MNDESELENELSALQPAKPSHELARNIEREMAGASRTDALVRDRGRRAVKPRSVLLYWSMWGLERLAWGTAGALALWLLMPESQLVSTHSDSFPVHHTVLAQTSPAVTVQPMGIQDGGVTFLDGGVPARLVRYWAVEHQPLSSGMELLRPREDVIVLPMKIQ